MPESFFSSALQYCEVKRVNALGHTFSICATANEKRVCNTEKKKSFHNVEYIKKILLHCTISRHQTLIKAIDSVGDPPLPIPNREVKPNSADGTAKICGRVGHRHFYKEAGVQKTPAFFFYTGTDALLSWRWRLGRTPRGTNFACATRD